MKSLQTVITPRYALLAVLSGLALTVCGQPLPTPSREIPLYPGNAPGSEKWDWEEGAITSPTGLPIVQNVVRPVRLCYPSDRAKSVGAAMIVVPGGGFINLTARFPARSAWFRDEGRKRRSFHGPAGRVAQSQRMAHQS